MMGTKCRCSFSYPAFSPPAAWDCMLFLGHTLPAPAPGPLYMLFQQPARLLLQKSALSPTVANSKPPRWCHGMRMGKRWTPVGLSSLSEKDRWLCISAPQCLWWSPCRRQCGHLFCNLGLSPHSSLILCSSGKICGLLYISSISITSMLEIYWKGCFSLRKDVTQKCLEVKRYHVCNLLSMFRKI